jgi:Tol biopolymer transport system component
MYKNSFITLSLCLASQLSSGANATSTIDMRTHAAPSPDGEKIAYHIRSNGTKPTLYIADSNGQNEQHLWGTTSTIEQEPRWSPNGKWIAFVSGHDYQKDSLQLHIVSPDGENHKTLTDIRTGSAKGPSWSPDSQQILFEIRNSKQGKSTLNIFDLQTASVHQLNTVGEGMLVQAEWSPDGKAIMVAERDPETPSKSDLWVLSLEHLDHRRQVTKTPEGETMPVWQSNNAIIFSRPVGESGQHDLFLFRFSDNSEHRLTKTDDVNEFFPIVSANGVTLYFDAFRKIEGEFQSSISVMEIPEALR